jgi:hypothetical protein
MGGVTPNYAFRFPYIDETITDVSTKNLADDFAAILTSLLDLDRTTSRGRASARLARFGSQAITAAAETAMIGTAETFDTDNAIDIATQPTRITVPAGMGGVYWAHALVDSISGTAWTSGQLAIAKNGTDVVRRKYWCASGQMATDLTLTTQVRLVPGDFLTATILFQGTPSPSNVSSLSLSAQRMTTT